MSRFACLLAVSALVLYPVAASARNTAHELPIKAAIEGPLGQEQLSDVRLFFGSQSHPKVAKVIRTGRTNKATRSMFRSDEEACEVAFLSALVALQRQAASLGANAVIEIKSNTGGPVSGSATTYKCAAGGAVARVNLTGTYVKLR